MTILSFLHRKPVKQNQIWFSFIYTCVNYNEKDMRQITNPKSQTNLIFEKYMNNNKLNKARVY